MKIAVLIVAAGRGQRAGGEIPKQYRQLRGKTVLRTTIDSFAEFHDIGSVAIAIHKDDMDLFKSATAGLPKKVTHIFGGKTRTASVHAGLLELAKSVPDIVLIHDAARPFVSADVIQEVIDTLGQYESALPGIPVIDALKTNTGDPVERGNLVRAQTPQGFHFGKILNAFNALDPDESYADDIEVARRAGLSIGICKGSEDNYKLTHPEDFVRAEREFNMVSRTGSGFDVHRVCEGKTLHLCGIEIDAGFSLEGHSDADVGLHAITDALLGAISAGDIGDHFPPSDPKWKGANSQQFLEHARNLISDRNGIIDHVDITLICEAPKIKPHREAMRQRISEILNVDIDNVSVKATTTEGLGFTGRREGIAAQSIANVRIPDA